MFRVLLRIRYLEQTASLERSQHKDMEEEALQVSSMPGWHMFKWSNKEMHTSSRLSECNKLRRSSAAKRIELAS